MRKILMLVVLSIMLFPLSAHALPFNLFKPSSIKAPVKNPVSTIGSVPSLVSLFGGAIRTIRPCRGPGGAVIGTLIDVGPPKGGAFVWTLGTMSYSFGPPSHVGQLVLGLAGTPLPCYKRQGSNWVKLKKFGTPRRIIMHGSSV